MYETNSNDITINTYNRNIAEYLKRTPSTYNSTHEPMLQWINTAVSMVSKTSKILEIGSGPGRDAKYIKKLGFDIAPSDAATKFVEYLHKDNDDALLLNVLRDPIPKGFAMIFANSVMPHFTPSNFNYVVGKIYNALPPNGVFAFSMKQGSGEAWINEKMHDKRYVRYWQASDMQLHLTMAGFKTTYLRSDIPGDLPSHLWSLFIATK